MTKKTNFIPNEKKYKKIIQYFKLNNKDIDNTLKFLNKKKTKSKLLSRKNDNIKFIKSIVPIMNKHPNQLENMAEFVSLCEVNFEEYYKKKHKGGLNTRRNSYILSSNNDSLDSSSSSENDSLNSQNDSNDNRIMHECSVCLDEFSIYGNGIERFICCPNTTACQHGCCVKCWCSIWLHDNVFNSNIPNDYIPRNVSCPTCRQNVNIRENILNNDEFNSENLQSQQGLDNVSDEFYNDIDLITDVIHRNVMQNNFLGRQNVSMRQMRSTVTYIEFKRFLRMMAMLLFIHYNVNELLEYTRRYNYTPSIFDIAFNNPSVQFNYRYMCVAIISCFCYFIEAIVIAGAIDNFIFNFRDIDDDEYDPEIIERYANSMSGGTKTKKNKKNKTKKNKKNKTKKRKQRKTKRKGGRMPIGKDSPPPLPTPSPTEDIEPINTEDLEDRLTRVNQILEQRFENNNERIQSAREIQQLIPQGSFGSIFVYTNALGFSLNEDIIVDELFVNMIIGLYDPNRNR